MGLSWSYTIQIQNSDSRPSPLWLCDQTSGAWQYGCIYVFSCISYIKMARYYQGKRGQLYKKNDLELSVVFGLPQAVDFLVIICNTGTEKKLGVFYVTITTK